MNYKTLPAQEHDKDKINKRRSKRASKFVHATHNDEDDLVDPTFSKTILSSITRRTSTGSDYEEDDEDLMGAWTDQNANYVNSFLGKQHILIIKYFV